MKTNIYSVYDRVRGVYDNPFIEPNNDSAKRAFLCACSDPRAIYIYSDLDLYCLGEFDTNTGEIISFKPEFICRGQSVFPKEMYADCCNEENGAVKENELSFSTNYKKDNESEVVNV